MRCSQFLKNFANKSAGAIYIKLLMRKIAKEGVTLSDSRFENNVAAYSGGAVYLYADSYQPINAGITDSTFYRNQAVDGGAIYCQKFKLIGMESDVILDGGHREKNSAVKGGFLHLSTCSVYQGEVGNNATHGGAIFANNSAIFSSTRVSFINNTARKSGGAIFAVDSRINLLHQSTSQIIFISNTVSSAAGKGGAIYIQDVACEGIKSIATQTVQFKVIPILGVKHFLFSNNSAASGSVLYGGLLDRCYSRSFLGIDHFKEVSQYEHEALAITSDPIKACFCRGDLQPDCAMRKTTKKKMRGEKIEVLVTSVDQLGQQSSAIHHQSQLRGNCSIPGRRGGKEKGRQLHYANLSHLHS